MALQIVAGTPGLWRDPLWTLGMPGLYALIAGASYYPHLENGDPCSLAEDNFGMGQLVSSAGTAAQIFEWLRDKFRHQDLPVVWCQLLLSPTEKEKADLNERDLVYYARPTHSNLRNAIDRWTGNVPAGSPAADISRTFFFFSGHGVQTNWYPVLLPSDYLDPALGQPKFENCIGVAELTTWMDRHPVAEHLALIDACRHEFSPLAAKGATANTSFPAVMPGGKSPRVAVSLSSTSPNAVSYQLPGAPQTFFGQAVLEALKNGVMGGANDARLAYRELVDYVKPRINALLHKAQPGTTLEQTVRQHLSGDDVLIVTELVNATKTKSQGPREGIHHGQTSAWSVTPAAHSCVSAPTTASVLEAMGKRFDPTLTVHAPIALDAMRQDFGEIDRRFGQKLAACLWQSRMALYALSDGQQIERDGSVMYKVQRNEDSSLVQVDLSLAHRSGGVLLVFEDEHFVQRERLAVALPTDTGARVPIRLSLAFSQVERGAQPKLLSIAARLGPSLKNPHYRYLWKLTQEADFGSLSTVAALIDPERLRRAAQYKRQVPTTVVAGMLLLARVGRIHDVGDWTCNLMRGSPESPDAAVLWAESLRAAMDRGIAAPFGVQAPIEEMAAALLRLGQYGMPFFADNLELAERLLRHVLREVRDGEVHRALLVVQQQLEQLFQCAMPSGHFVALQGLPRPARLDSDSGALKVPEMLELIGRRT